MPYVIFALLSSLPPSRNSDPRSHTQKALASPPHLRFVPCIFIASEKTSPLSPPVDSRRIAPTHARRAQSEEGRQWRCTKCECFNCRTDRSWSKWCAVQNNATHTLVIPRWERLLLLLLMIRIMLLAINGKQKRGVDLILQYWTC